MIQGTQTRSVTMRTNHPRLTSARRILPGAWIRRVVTSLTVAGLLTLGSVSAESIPENYQDQLKEAFVALDLQDDQRAAYAAEMKNFMLKRKGVQGRVGRQGGDLKVFTTKSINRLARKCSDRMSKVLSDEQMPHFEQIIALLNQKYMADVFPD